MDCVLCVDTMLLKRHSKIFEIYKKKNEREMKKEIHTAFFIDFD